MVFFVGHGGGQWFLAQDVPVIQVEAGGRTAGLAQVGIVVCVVGGGGGSLQCAVFGVGWTTRGSAPCTRLVLWSV